MNRLISIVTIATSLMLISCKKEPVLYDITSFEVPELVHVYGGHPFTLPIVTEPEAGDISKLEFTHPEETNFNVEIRGNKAILTYVPLEENDKTEGMKVRSEILRIGNEALGYKDVVVHVASQPITAAFLVPFGVAEISDGAVLKVEGKEQTDGSHYFGILAAVGFTDIAGQIPDFEEDEFSCTVEAPSGKIISKESVNSGNALGLTLYYTKDVVGEMAITYKFTDRYSVAGKDFDNEYTLSFSIENWYIEAEGAYKSLHEDGYLLSSMPFYGASFTYDKRNRITNILSGIVGPIDINPDTGICSAFSSYGSIKYNSNGLLEQLVLKNPECVDSLYCEYDASARLVRYDHQFIVLEDGVVPYREEADYIWKDGLIAKVEGRQYLGSTSVLNIVAEYEYGETLNKYELFTLATHTLRDNRDFVWPLLLSGLMGPAGNKLPSSYTFSYSVVSNGETVKQEEGEFVSSYEISPDGRVFSESLLCKGEAEYKDLKYSYISAN